MARALDEDEDDRRGSESEGEPEKPQSVRERKRAALYPPISSICSALGGFEEFRNEKGEITSAYALGDQVVGCLKDLKRFWRMDDKDEDRTVARVFYETGVLKNDLVPILHTTINTSDRGDRIALAAVELMTAMTWPIDVVEELRDAKLQDDLKASMDYNSLIEAQQSYKAAILHSGSLRPIFQLLSKPLAKHRRDRTEKDNNMISLILFMFRNLAAIKDKVTSSQSANAMEMSNLQSEYIVQLAYENIFALLLAIAHDAESSEYSPWNMVILDIFHLIFRTVTPKELVTPVHQIDQNRLEDLLDLEDRSKRAVLKKSNSRHSRFGTTVALKKGTQQYIVHKQSSIAKGVEQSMDAVKKAKTKKFRQDDDLAPPSQLRPEAISVLQQVAISFIESAFNPFFASVSKDIRMERAKVQPSDNLRFMFLSRFFLEFYLALRATELHAGIDPASEQGHDFDLVTEMTEPIEIAYVTRRMKSSLEDKPQNWKEVHAGVECFVQILLVIDAMASSGVQDYVDLADILQNKLYYEAEQLDMVLTVISSYKNQSYAYLNSVIHLAYVLLRMLEKFSKSKAYMYVRKKAKARSKKKKGKHGKEEAGDGLGMGDDSDLEPDREAVSSKDHAFEFETFEAKFAQESVLQTCLTYLESYRSFKSPDQLKRIVALMHRLAVRAKSDALFYKPVVLNLFDKIRRDDVYTAAHRGEQAVADLYKVMNFILRRFIKTLSGNEFLAADFFVPKTRGQIGKMRAGADDPYATSEDESAARAGNREYEVLPGYTHTQQIGIAIAALVDSEQLVMVQHIRNQLVTAAAHRREIIESIDGVPDASLPADLEQPTNDSVDMDADAMDDKDSDEALRKQASELRKGGPSPAAMQAFRLHYASYESDEFKQAVLSNGYTKCLMRLFNWYNESPDGSNKVDADHPAANEDNVEKEEDKTEWVIPVDQVPSQLEADVKTIDDFLADPIDPSNGKTAADLMRKKRKKPVRRKRRRIEEEEGEDDDHQANGASDSDGPKRKKRGGGGGGKRGKKRKSILSSSDEDGSANEAAPRKRSKKAQKEQVVYKSAQFINDSDDESDAERDALFFAAEAALRDALATGSVAMSAPAGTRQGPSTQTKKKKAAAAATKSTTKKAPSKKKKKAAVPQARDPSQFDDGMVSDIHDTTSDSDKSDSASTRRWYKKAASSPPPAPALTTGDSSSDDDSEPTQNVTKQKRIVVDSDEE